MASTTVIDKLAGEGATHFWRGFGFESCPSFEGKSVLEIGCGNGKRLLEVVRNGSPRAVGVDPHPSAIESAGKSFAASIWKDRLQVFHGFLDELPAELFDVVLSENALEHVLDVPDLLGQIRGRLKPGGQCLIGFGPLYHAPGGDHGWLRETLPGWPHFRWPWGHLILEAYAFRQLSKKFASNIAQTRDWPYLSLNQHTAANFEKMFAKSGMRIASVRRNYVNSKKGRLFASFAKLPWLSKYCTLNMFVVLIGSQARSPTPMSKWHAGWVPRRQSDYGKHAAD